MAKKISLTATKEKVRTKSIETVLANIEKLMGSSDDPVIQKAPSVKEVGTNIPSISFGYPEVDIASGGSGVPQGKMIEIFGAESGGKSFLTLKLISSAQNAGMECCLVDAENSYHAGWADQQGVDTENLWLIQKPMSAEKTLDYVDELCKSGSFGLIVVDSTASLIPQKELEGSIGDQDYALLARAMSKACRKIVQHCAQSNTTCVFINQIREKMGVTYGSNKTTPGGRALKFYSHQRILVTPMDKIKSKDKEEKIIARRSIVEFVKNKTAPPFGKCIIEIVFDKLAANPIVKLCNMAKDYKILSFRDGTFRINKSLFENEKKNVDTGSKTVVELADYLVTSGLIDQVLNAYIKEAEEDENVTEIDKDVMGLVEDPTTRVSPLEGTIVDTEELSEVVQDAIDQSLVPEEEELELE